MKNLLALLILATTTAHAVQCPTGTPDAFSHVTGPNIASQPWGINTSYLSQGWNIQDSFMPDSNPRTSISQNTKLQVIYNPINGDNYNFTVVCRYKLEKNPDVYLDVANSNLYNAPTNPNFKRLSSGGYICITKAGAPENCADSGIHPVVFGQ
jgi:hypothetical protein